MAVWNITASWRVLLLLLRQDKGGRAIAHSRVAHRLCAATSHLAGLHGVERYRRERSIKDSSRQER